MTGLVYLNNRYYDPQLGVFLSVDPLVSKTGDPYLYAGGNPTTLSDPSGLCTVTQGMHSYDDGKGSCGGGLDSVGKSCDSNACGQTATFSFDPVPGAGTANLNLFISAGSVGGRLNYRGDGRGPSPSAGCRESRVCIRLDLESGRGFVGVNYSCRVGGACFDAYKLNGNVNELTVTRSDDGGFKLSLLGKHADPQFLEEINAFFQIDLNRPGFDDCSC